MTTYAIIDASTNVCVNMCVWDNVTPWEPPLGCYVVNNDDGAGEIGWIYDPANGQWSPPNVPASPS